ncbi:MULTISPECIES: acyl carrier protein [Methylocaldum]|uniref:acyl carrier protein n=1 Tax=unclassified Methylocaldum TaxID=2622260 RepID=UPI00098A1ACE|nr:acyl carrier protein [Methylocaldum sp. 14B]MBP1150038.1 acyl carrier protein [Methylocaldum sp. RMAD-M]MVF23234.1 acyl carrier protein [Methylocaldum sp. BRCS4]
MNVEKLVKDILKQHLQLGDSVNRFTPETALLGDLPELDSMGVVNIITAIEESVGCTIDDDEISADVFATLGSLMSFVESKL